MVAVEPLGPFFVNRGLSDRYAGPVTRLETNIVHMMADAKDRSEGFVNPRRAGVLIVSVIALLGDHDDYEYQEVE